MRECACGFTCGTDAALQRHLEQIVSPECEALPQRKEEPAEPPDPSTQLRFVAAVGDVAAIRELLEQGATMLTAAPLEAAVRAGHCEVASLLIRHCRKKRLKRRLDAANVVANALNWAAAGYCSVAGPSVVAMLIRDKHINLLRKSPLDSWQRLSLLLGKPGASLEDNDDPFTDAGRAAIAVAQRAAVPPSNHATWASAKARRPGAAKLAAQELVAEQIHVIAADLDRHGWSPSVHLSFPPRFRSIVFMLLLGSHSPASVIALANGDVLLHLIRELAQRMYWEA